MKKRNIRLYVIVSVIIVALYALYQSFILFSKPVKTEKLISFTADDYIQADGFVIRKEIMIQSSAAGTPDYLAEDGDKVKKDSAVAVLYSGTADLTQRRKITDLEKRISQLQSSISAKDIYLSDAITLEKLIDDKLNEISSMTNNKNTNTLAKLSDDLQLLLNKKQLILNGAGGYEAKLNSLQKELDNLKNSSSGKYGTISAPVAGYFTSRYDGYENLLDADFLKKNGISAYNSVYELKSGSDKPANYIGKIEGDFNWYYACVLSAQSFKDYEEGDALKLRFPDSQSEGFAVTVWYLQRTDDGKAFVIFYCENASPDILNLRHEKAEIITTTYNGYKVSNKSVRMQNEQTGIFVLEGVQVQFKPVKVLFSRDDYTIITNADSKTSLLPYEEVVLEGKNLFDGKIVQ